LLALERALSVVSTEMVGSAVPLEKERVHEDEDGASVAVGVAVPVSVVVRDSETMMVTVSV
jgi:hypothetical protein